MTQFSRRIFLKTTAGVVAVAATGAGRAVFAADRPLIVGSYAGTFEEAMKSTFVQKFVADTGVPVELSIGGPSQWLSQVDANPDSPPVDVILTSPRDALSEGATGNYGKISDHDLPNLADVDPRFVDICGGYGVAFDYGGGGLAVNTNAVKNPPKSIKEFVQRTIDGEWVAALPTLSWQATPTDLIWAFNDALGGTVDDISPFIDAMKAMKPNLVFWTGLPDFLTLMQSGEADIGVYTDGRTWAFNRAGNPWLQFINPEEGAVIECIAAMVPAHAHPKAWDFVNYMLDPVLQGQFAAITYYGMTNSKIVYPDSVKDIVTRWQQGRLVPTEEIAAVTPKWVETWNRELGF
ncbi:extracellular solute-binding protein [Martelella sp. HB161492]|uniref:extracellular solute-binding protein n=1 Tax=Martelella sp. HB161492 TaxID=2720726 RepID=UPI0015928566|nr:extracellular solute-binding protein [Martelella sp. HB161492]